MASHRTCIICGAPAKSNEHIFPAALGGRRTNRGIYCHDHNIAFGRLVTRLETQLAMMNGALEVRPDRKDKAKPYIFKDGDTRYRLIGADIQIDMPPPLDKAQLKSDMEIQLAVPSMDVAQRWVEENQSDKVRIEIKQAGAARTHYRTEGNRIRLAFGGCDFLQAVGYLALTFFAHSFPGAARQEGLKPFKAMLQRELKNDKANWQDELVWWDGRETSSVVGANPHEFGHVLAVGICGTTARAYAYVSFFSCLSFGVDLGAVEYDGEPRTVCTFINPLAERAGDSVTVAQDDVFNAEIGKPGICLHDMMHSGRAVKAVGRFQEKLHLRNAWEIVDAIMPRVPKQPSSEGLERFSEIVREHGQPLLNLLGVVVTGVSQEFTNYDHAQRALNKMVAKDESQDNGLAPEAWQALQESMKVIALAMHEIHLEGALDPQAVLSLFFGQPGIALITCKVVLPALLSLSPEKSLT